MDKNKIKSFAIWARRNLIAAISEKANRIGISENKIEEAIAVQGGFKLEGKDEIFSLSKNDRDALVSQVREKGFEQVMEEVAYTWFNRFMGLRYMEVNDYIPTGVRILSSSVEGKIEPDVLTKVSEIIDELGLNANEVYDLLDTGDTLDREKAYRIILVKQCNELGKILPQMFEKISDYTELLLPDNLLEEGSVIRKMVEDIEESDWLEEVEIIGWMYQYYNNENNELVYDGSLKKYKITKELLPSATQIFTPNWVVRYMVENSLGRLWLTDNPNQDIQKQWKYYIEESEQEQENIKQEHRNLSPESIKVLDPCMGSGHILVYAFDVLYQIYTDAGYSEREIPKKILQNNIYGLDIDDRASQIASFALIMKARGYNRRLFREIEREHIEINVCSIKESNGISREMIDYFANGDSELKDDVEYLVNVFNDAKEYGSILEVKAVNFKALNERLTEIEEDNSLIFGDYRIILLDTLPAVLRQCKIMSKKYEVCITNPPYLNSTRMNDKLFNYVSKNYSDTKTDFSMIFFEKVIKDYCMKEGYISFVTTTSWMYLKSFQTLREKVINELEFESLVEFGTELFDGKVGHNPIVAWVNKNTLPIQNMKAIRLVEFCYSRREEKKIEFFNEKNMYKANQKEFKKIPGSPIAYWVSDKVLSLFTNTYLHEYAVPCTGMQTGNNEKYIRLWYEVDNENTNINKKQGYWKKYNDGGDFRKWYGGYKSVINWENNGEAIRLEKSSVIRNEGYFFTKGLTWKRIGANEVGLKILPSNFIFDQAGDSLFANNSELELIILAFFNSKIAKIIFQILSPTLNLTAGVIRNFPIINFNITNNIKKMILDNVKKCKGEWNSFEASWDFIQHPLLRLIDKDKQHKLECVFLIWETECEEAFEQLRYNEEELNRIFIDIYGLQDELTPEVEDKDITIRKADRERDIKSFISYAVGCIFGRYSIDAEGLIYAGGTFSNKWQVTSDKCLVRDIKKDEEGNIISDTWVECSFTPDVDNIIPITEDEYFEDDIVSRFIEFVRTVYSYDTLEENLDFIADSIGRKASETARQAIRRYFIKDFYKDHLKVYQKRPIYWMFESGKNDGFKALIYMHRYNEQTVAKVRTDYLHTLQRKYEAEIQRQQLIVDSEEYTAKDRTAAKKKIDRISKQIEECREYDQVVAHLANEKISIDLDDGVKVNYEKFQGVKVINSKDKEIKMDLLAKI